MIFHSWSFVLSFWGFIWFPNHIGVRCSTDLHKYVYELTYFYGFCLVFFVCSFWIWRWVLFTIWGNISDTISGMPAKHINIFTLPTLALTLLIKYFCFFFFFLMIYLLLNILLSSVYFAFNNSLCCSFIVSILFGSLLVNFGILLLFCQNFKLHWQGWYTFLLAINFGLAWLADTWTSCKLPAQ